MKILLATHNKFKIKESTNILEKLLGKIEIKSLEEVDIIEEVEESAPTLEGNAILKAEEIYEQLKDHNEFDYIVSEDFGFFVEAFPSIAGVHAKRWHPGSDDDRGNAVIKLFEENNETNKNAYYKSVYVAIARDGKQIMVDGVLNAQVGNELKGDGGFAYDKILLMPDGRHLSEYSFEEKADISTRKLALTKLANLIKE